MDMGYKDIIPLSVPVNTNLYSKKYRNDSFSYDISFVTHAPNISLLLVSDPIKNKKIIDEMLQELTSHIIDKKSYAITLKDYKDLLSKFDIDNELKNEDYERIRGALGGYISKTSYPRWIIEKKYRLHLFGSAWEHINEFQPYSHPSVPRGDELADVYNSSKINLHIGTISSSHQRVFEIISSGGFLLVMKFPQDKDCHPLENDLKEGEGYIFFEGKKDLYNKIDYYLNNEDERIKIIKKGQKKVQKYFSYSVFCKNAIKRINKRLYKNNNN